MSAYSGFEARVSPFIFLISLLYFLNMSNFLVKNLGYRLVKMFNEDWVYAHPESVNEKAKRWPLAGR